MCPVVYSSVYRVSYRPGKELTIQGFASVTGDLMEQATHGECGPPLYEDDTLR